MLSLAGDACCGSIRSCFSSIGPNGWWIFTIGHLIQILIAAAGAVAANHDAKTGLRTFFILVAVLHGTHIGNEVWTFWKRRSLDYKETFGDVHWGHWISTFLGGAATSLTSIIFLINGTDRSLLMIFTCLFGWAHVGGTVHRSKQAMKA